MIVRVPAAMVVLILAACLGRAWGAGLAAAGASDAVVVPLADLAWSRNAEPVEDLAREDADGERRVVLPVDGTGVRWTTVFTTDGAGTHRLALSWEPGPDGLLLELLIDGERHPPALDGWRPTRRHVVTDLGPRWLGDGEHLLEFIAREDVADAVVVLRALELRSAGD